MNFGRQNYGRSYNNRGNQGNVSSFDKFIVSRRAEICDTRGKLNTHDRQFLFNHQKLETGLNFKNYNDIPITVTGASMPSTTNFSELSLHNQLGANLSECGYEDMTPVQKASLPLGLGKYDLLTCAQTGSGKTVGFLVPFIQRIIEMNASNVYGDRYKERQRNYCHFPLVLILTPTRELAKQVYVQAIRLCHATGVMPGLVYGGISKSMQLRELRQGGVDILIGTPGRVNDLISSGDITLSAAFGLVLDEGDKMLDMGFHDQILEATTNGNFPVSPTYNDYSYSKNEKVENIRASERQVFLFSATFPDEIKKLANNFLDGNKSAFVSVGVIGATNKDIKQHFVHAADEFAKSEKLTEIITSTIAEGENNKLLVFVNMKRTADELERSLRDKKVVRVAAIHGDKSQDNRDRVLEMFKNNNVKVLVATDVAARGLDIPCVSAVVNYDLAPSTDDHVHRIGRTGRAGNTGHAYTLISNNENKNLFELVKMLKKESIEVPEFMERLSYESRNKSSKFGRGGRRGGGGFGGRGNNRFGGGFGGRGGGFYGGSRNNGSRW